MYVHHVVRPLQYLNPATGPQCNIKRSKVKNGMVNLFVNRSLFYFQIFYLIIPKHFIIDRGKLQELCWSAFNIRNLIQENK